MIQIRSHRLLGISLVMLSSLAFSAQNIVSRIFFAQSVLLDRTAFGGFVTPTLSNIVFLLALRMGMMTVLLGGISHGLYPKTFNSLRALFKTSRLLASVIASGASLFLGLTLLYAALGQMATGLVIATVFIHPALILLLAWRFFHQPPRLYQIWLMVVIFIGVLFTTVSPSSNVAPNPVLGIIFSVGSALGLAFYNIFAELSLKGQAERPGIHPVPFSLCTFAIVALSSCLILLSPQPITIEHSSWSSVIALSVLAAFLTLLAYISVNTGIRYIGASLTSLLSSTTPALSTLLAWWLMQETLQLQQVLGIGLVTIGVGTLSIKSSKEETTISSS